MIHEKSEIKSDLDTLILKMDVQFEKMMESDMPVKKFMAELEYDTSRQVHGNDSLG